MLQYIFFAFGTLCIAWGFCTFILRDRKPEWFARYAALREKHGDKKARTIHTLKHVVGLIAWGILNIAYGYFSF